jgi:hypothetical protein
MTPSPRPNLDNLLRQIALDLGLTPASAIRVHIEHEQWCREVDGTGACSCVPTVIVNCDQGEFTYRLTPDI